MQSPNASLRLLDIVGPYRPPGLNSSCASSAHSSGTALTYPLDQRSPPTRPTTPPLATRSRLTTHTLRHTNTKFHTLFSTHSSPHTPKHPRPKLASPQLRQDYQKSGQRRKIVSKWKTTPRVEELSCGIAQGLSFESESEEADDEEEGEDNDSEADAETGNCDAGYQTDYSNLEFSSSEEEDGGRGARMNVAASSPQSDASSYVLLSTGAAYGTPSSSQQPTQSPPNRRKSSSHDDEHDSDSDSSSRNRKRRRQADPDTPQRFGCPYYRFNPQDPTHQRCKSKSFPTLARIKGHVLRSHLKPRQCDRCNFRAGDQGQISHHLRVKNCAKVEWVPVDVETVRMGSELARNGKSKTWVQVCMLLFGCAAEECPTPWEEPAEVAVMSPCVPAGVQAGIVDTAMGGFAGSFAASGGSGAEEDALLGTPDFQVFLREQLSSVIAEILPGLLVQQMPTVIATYRRRFRKPPLTHHCQNPPNPALENLDSPSPGSTQDSNYSSSFPHHSVDNSPLVHTTDYRYHDHGHNSQSFVSQSRNSAAPVSHSVQGPPRLPDTMPSPFDFLNIPTEDEPLIPFTEETDASYSLFAPVPTMEMAPAQYQYNWQPREESRAYGRQDGAEDGSRGEDGIL